MMSRERLGEVLPHGWWPIQWLRIAYVLWVDQAWYWRHIRPHLPGRRQGWGILVQVTLGTLTAVLLLSGAAGAILERAGVCVYWDQWLSTAGMMVGLVVAIGIGRTLLGRVARGVPTIAHLGVPLGAPATVRERLWEAPLVSLTCVTDLFPSSPATAAGATGFLLGASLAGYWICRQIPDEGMRRRLADPEAAPTAPVAGIGHLTGPLQDR